MRAVVRDRYGTVDTLEVREVEVPHPREREVLVRVHAAGVDRGVWHLMTGLPYLVRIAGYGLRAPRSIVLGTELTGVVEAVGQSVTRFAPGDAVFGAGEGTFAEFACAGEDKLAAAPANLPFDESAAVAVSGSTALQGLRDHAQVRAGQRVLILGASGGVGTYAVQLAKVFGAEVTGVCSTSKVDLVRSIGADHVVDYTREDPGDGDRRYDAVLDIGGNRPIRSLRRLLEPRGRLVIVGGEGGGRWLGGADRQLRAVLLSPFTRHTLRTFIAEETHHDLLALKDLIEAGRVKPVVDRTFALVDTPRAIQYVADGNARGKVVIALGGSSEGG